MKFQDTSNNIQVSGDYVSIGTGKSLLDTAMLSGVSENKTEKPKIFREDFMPQVDFSICINERMKLQGIIPPKAIFVCIGDSLENAAKVLSLLFSVFFFYSLFF